MHKVTSKPFLEKYNLGEYLGSGSTSIVLECTHKNTNKKYAVKILDKYELKYQMDRIEHEIKILSTLDHPNIIKLVEVLRDNKNIFMVFEKVDTEDLFDRIQSYQGFTEDKAVGLVRQIVKAVHYLHERNIVHCDIKPENIFICTEGGTERLKLGDFGYSTILEDNQKLMNLVGTHIYFSPEQLTHKGYGIEVDMWALGVTVFGILCARCLFYDDDEEKAIQQQMTGDLKYLDEMQNCSELAKDFMKRLLVVDPKKRMTSAEAQLHPWVTQKSVLVSPSRAHTLSPLIERTKQKNRAGSSLSPFCSPLHLTPLCVINTNSPLVEGEPNLVKRNLFVEYSENNN